MGFLDELKSKLPFGQEQGGYGRDSYAQGDGYDDYYDDGGSDAGYGDDYASGGNGSPDQGYGAYSDQDGGNGMLGQTRRGEAESVAVYTRSGQLVGDADRHATTFNPPTRSHDAYRPGAYDTPSSPWLRLPLRSPCPWSIPLLRWTTSVQTTSTSLIARKHSLTKKAPHVRGLFYCAPSDLAF